MPQKNISSVNLQINSFARKGRKQLARFFEEICNESNLDGVKYITLEGLHLIERLFWCATVFASFGLSAYMFFHLYLKLRANPVIISFQPEETSISHIPFPAITLCNVNIFKAPKINEVVRILNEFDSIFKIYEKWKRFNETIAILEHLAHYCLAAPSYQRLIGATQQTVGNEDVDLVESIQYYLEMIKANETLDSDYILGEMFNKEIEEFRGKASHNCEDMILKCMWQKQLVPCQKIFFHIHTQHGSCCVFNMMPLYILKKIPNNDSRVEEEKRHLPLEAIEKWEHFGSNDLIHDDEHADSTSNNGFSYPSRQKMGGNSLGLSLLINPELDMYSTCTTNDAWGFKIVAHSPLSFPSIMNYGEAIPPNSEVFLEVKPEITTADEHKLKSVNVKDRNCYFPSDPEARLDHYKFYSSGNCLDECIAKYTYANCSCVRHFMPRNSSQKLCGARKLECAEEVRENLTAAGKKGFCAKCIPACTEIKYRMRLTQFPIRSKAAKSEFEHLSHNENETNKRASNYSILHIYLGSDTFYTKERKTLYDSYELLSHAGGVLGLTLGFSMTSLLEILYFFTLKVVVRFLCHRDKTQLQKDSKSKARPTKLLK